MEEIWKDIEGCDGKYQASNKGNIRNKHKLLSQWTDSTGYLCTHLPNRYKKSILVHRLVAETFIPIPDELKQYVGTQILQINHKDECKQNNVVENLEWCTAKYNSNYGTRNERMGEKLKGRKPSENTIKASVERCSRKVCKLSVDGEVIEIYDSLAEAERKNKNVHHSNIIRCCNESGRLKTTGGFKWKYAD